MEGRGGSYILSLENGKDRKEKGILSRWVQQAYISGLLFRYNIVVTRRAKKDMSNAEKAVQKKLIQRTKLEHAEVHRKHVERRVRRR